MALNEKYEGMGVRVISVDSGSRSAAAEDFLEEQGVEHILLSDPDGVVRDLFGVQAIPVTVLIDEEGRVVFRHLGYSEEIGERLDREVETLVVWRDAA